MTGPKPFHEAIVDVVRTIGNAPGEDLALYVLVRLVNASEIVANHDAIEAAFREKYNLWAWRMPIDGLLAHIASEKARVAAERRKIKKGLMEASEKLRQQRAS